MYRSGRVAVAERVLRVSTTFRRSVEQLGVRAGSPTYRGVTTAMRSLASSKVPGPGDYETSFAPGQAHVRRVTGQNVWLLYRFDEQHLFILTARGQPPVPAEG
jgi:hypothetical protein